MKRFLLLAFLVYVSTSLSAQIFPSKNYPQGYFRDPLNVPISLAGNFGELRPNHYHMGLDIRTEKRENLPIYAAAEGYIAKVKVEPAGFGQAIYINHPNGYTTVYAHLNEFFPELSAYVKQQQYKLESWRVFLTLPVGMFPVKKGDFVAFSGSTGGSEAPHVHFEIRNTTTDVNLNPMLFGLPIQDNTRPTILRLAVYDRTRSIYEQSPVLIPLRKTGNSYTTAGKVINAPSSKASFAISAFDTNSGTPNRNGIYQAVIYDNDKPVTGFQMDNISYENTRNINAHIDYKTKANGGPFLQQLFQLYGYVNSIYHSVRGDGTIDLTDGVIHNMKIEVKDPYGNTSDLKFSVRFPGVKRNVAEPSGKTFYPQMLDGYEAEDCAFYIGEKCLYDSVHIHYARIASMSPNSVSAIHVIGQPYIPLQDSLLVRIKPTQNTPIKNSNRVVMQRFAGNKKTVQKVEWQSGWASAKFRDFGSFQLLVDEEPPSIQPIGFAEGANLSRVSRIVFVVKDNLEVFKNFRAELDGKWLRFSNDKGKSFIYIFDERCPPGPHTLKIMVEDEAGNQAARVFNFTR